MADPGPSKYNLRRAPRSVKQRHIEANESAFRAALGEMRSNYGRESSEPTTTTTNAMTNKKQGTKRRREEDTVDEDVDGDGDLQQQDQVQDEDQVHMPKRTRSSTISRPSAMRATAIPSMPDVDDDEQNLDQEEVGVKSGAAEENDLPENVIKEEYFKSEEDSKEYQDGANGEGGQQQLLVDHTLALPKYGDEDSIEVVIKQEAFIDLTVNEAGPNHILAQEEDLDIAVHDVTANQDEAGPSGMVDPVSNGHDNVYEKIVDEPDVASDRGSNEVRATSSSPQLHKPAGTSQQPSAPEPNDSVDAEALYFTITPAQRAPHFAQRATDEAAIPDIEDFMRDLKLQISKAVASFATTIELPDSFKIGKAWREDQPEEWLSLFGYLGRVLDDLMYINSQKDSDHESTRSDLASKSWMQEILRPQTQTHYRVIKMIEALLGAALTDWVLAADALSDQDWKDTPSWAVGSVLTAMFSEEAEEVFRRNLLHKIVDRRLKKGHKHREARKMARKFAGFVKKLLEIRDTDMWRSRGGVAAPDPERWWRDQQEDFWDNLTDVFEMVIELRLLMEKPGNVYYRFEFPAHFDEIWEHGKRTNMRVILGVLPTIIREGWQGMLEPNDKADKHEETLSNHIVSQKEKWRKR